MPPDDMDLLAAGETGETERGRLGSLLEGLRPRLRRMVELRLDPRLAGRLDPSDVLQEAFGEVTRRLPEWQVERSPPFFVWVRLMTGQTLAQHHRRHLGTLARDADREVAVARLAPPEASSLALSAFLVGRQATPSEDLMRGEATEHVRRALEALGADDREVLALRSFEGLSNQEVAAVLEISERAASNRWVRALARLQERLAQEGVTGLPPIP